VTRLILGLHTGHNASVCLGDETGILYAVQEERLTGEKNYWGFPKEAVKMALKSAGASAADLFAVAHASHQALSNRHSRDDVVRSYRRQDSLTGKIRQRFLMPLIMEMVPRYGQKRLFRQIEEAGFGRAQLSFHDHHACHAATAYYGLRSDVRQTYTVLTCDGAGDNLSATVRTMGGGRDDCIATSSLHDSLGSIYAWITYALGFVPMEHEYKLMGMAPYASEEAACESAKVFHEYLGFDDSGLRFRRKTKLGTNSLSGRIFQDIRGRRFDHICAGVQRFTEDILTAWATTAVRKTAIPDVLASGGLFMNVKANKRIAAQETINSFEAFPSCGDETISLGAYYLEAAARFGHEAVPPLNHFYLGDDLEEEATRKALATASFPYHRPKDMALEVAKLLAAGHPVARCAGPMEFGARALGNRSILADPGNQDVVRVINQMVKKRDFWMPFAPLVSAEQQHRYLKNPKKLRSPYMMMTFDTRDNFREMIAAVHNADLTCRAQILTPEQNPAVYDILKAFEQLTGRGVLLNTSFNLHGFPIVRDAAQALHVFANSGLRHLQAGDFLVRKE
jgi:carbamoyltransferase